MAETRTHSSNTAAAVVAAASFNVTAAAAAAAASSAAADDRESYTLDGWLEFFKFQRGRDSPSDARNVLLIIAILITTATYQAVLSPPGGLWQDNGDKDNRAIGQEAGKTILGSNGFDYRFGIFLATNTAGFFGSLFIIEILTEGFPLRLELGFTVFALVASYDFAMISIIPYGNLSTLFSVLSIFLPLLIVFAARTLRKARILSRRRAQGH